MEGNNSLSFTRRSVATTGQVPVPREQGLAISIGDNIYYYGGRGRGNNSLEEIAGSVFHVYDTKSASWSKIDVKPPRGCSDLFIYGTAIGTNIWIYDRGFWLCFDTVERQWRNVDLSVKKDDYLSLHLSSIGVIGQSLYYYDGNHNSFEKKVYQINTATAQISTSDAEGFGDHPQERHEMFMHAVSEDTLILYAPVDSYDKAKAEKRGELFYYDLKEANWARAKQVKNDPALNLYANYYIGRIGSSLYFSPRSDAHANEWWALDLLTATWEKKIINSDKTEVSSNYATVVGDKLYCWMADGTMTVVDTEGMPNPEQQRKIDEQLAQMAREALSHIKPPVTIIDEYIPEPILINTDLDPANRTKPVIHREIAKDFANIFPLLDQQKIIESTVATPSESVFMHKNYIHYLTLAWANHFSVILSPDIVFYTVLCEIADEILTNPDAFRHLFTDSTEKKPIMSITHDTSKIDVNQLIQGIAKNLPVDASIFTANFSCSTAESRLAMQSAFCEAMSAYYFYMSTMCGIPRVKVLGTKQDWETVEHKIHRMRTEVFNQDGSSNQKMSLYLKNAEEQTRKIYTTRDPAFWKDMFGINRCMSGHTDVVEGWINMFYRKGYASKHDGVVRYLSDDFYNLKAHISTVKWQNVETQRSFELKSGLLYSNVVAGESPEDTKFPWLEPQFCHVIVETDGGKMTPETFTKYIETTLKGRDKKLMQQFYDVLKDDPIELVKGGTNEINFRFELVSRLMEHWIQEYLKTGQTPSVFDLNAEPFKSALDFYTKVEKSNDKAFTKMKNKIIEYLELNTNITGFHNQHLFATVEHEFIDVLMKKPQQMQELTVFVTTQQSIEKVSQFLLNPSCNVVCFSVGRTSMSYNAFKPDNTLDYSAFAAALMNTKAPLHTLVLGTIKGEDVAKAVADLCRRPNGLKNLRIESHWGESDPEITKILIQGQVESKSLTSISLSDLGRKEVVVEGHKKWVDVESDELKECIMKNLPLNPSLQTIGFIRFKFTPAEQARALSIPSLKSIQFTDLTDISFLDTTTKLEVINCTLNCTAEQIVPLQKFVMREDCALKTLSVEKSTLHPGAGAVLGKGLVHNRSITGFNLRKSTIKSEDDILALVESVVEWLEKPYCQLETLNLSDMSKANKTLLSFSTPLLSRQDHKSLPNSFSIENFYH